MSDLNANKVTKTTINTILTQLELTVPNSNLAINLQQAAITSSIDLTQLVTDLQFCFKKSYEQHQSQQIKQDPRRHEADNLFLINLTNLVSKWPEARQQLQQANAIPTVVVSFDNLFKAIYDFLRAQEKKGVVLPDATAEMQGCIYAVKAVLPAWLAQDRLAALLAGQDDNKRRIEIIEQELAAIARQTAQGNPNETIYQSLLEKTQKDCTEALQQRPHFFANSKPTTPFKNRRQPYLILPVDGRRTSLESSLGSPVPSTSDLGSQLSADYGRSSMQKNTLVATSYILNCINALTLPQVIAALESKLSTLSADNNDGLAPSVLPLVIAQANQTLMQAKAYKEKADQFIARLQLDSKEPNEYLDCLESVLTELNKKENCDDADLYIKDLLNRQYEIAQVAMDAADRLFSVQIPIFTFYKHSALFCSWQFDADGLSAILQAEINRVDSLELNDITKRFYKYLLIDAQQHLPAIMQDAIEQFTQHQLHEKSIHEVREQELAKKLADLQQSASNPEGIDHVAQHVGFLLEKSLQELATVTDRIARVLPTAMPTSVQARAELSYVQDLLMTIEDPAALVKIRLALINKERALQEAIYVSEQRVLNARLQGGVQVSPAPLAPLPMAALAAQAAATAANSTDAGLPAALKIN